jgi:aryl-alcohol dehydrogenase-like predicted oxidoreductase
VCQQALQGIPRSCYYIATKVGRYQPEVDRMFDFSAERTLQSVDESLARLGLEYVDGIQVCFFYHSVSSHTNASDFDCCPSYLQYYFIQQTKLLIVGV